MTDKITFTAPLPPRGLRVNSKTVFQTKPPKQTQGWRAQLVRGYQEQVWCAGNVAMAKGPRGNAWVFNYGWERARLRLVWCHAGVAPDPDNALGSLKHLIDVLTARSVRPLGIIIDDTAEHLEIAPVELRKVRRQADECVEVTVERLR